MKTSITTRLAGFAASVLVTFGVVSMMADYAFPTAPAMQIASTAR